MELISSTTLNKDVKTVAIRRPIGFKLQLRSRSFIARHNADHLLSPLQKFNPHWQIELAYSFPWMLNNWLRFIFKMKSNIYPNYGGTEDQSFHFTDSNKVFDLIPEFDIHISPYFFIAFKDKALFVLSVHYAYIYVRGLWVDFEVR